MPKVPISIEWSGGKPVANPDHVQLKAHNDWAEWVSDSNFTVTFPNGVDAPATGKEGHGYVAKSKVFATEHKGVHSYDVSAVSPSGETVVADPSIEVIP